MLHECLSSSCIFRNYRKQLKIKSVHGHPKYTTKIHLQSAGALGHSKVSIMKNMDRGTATASLINHITGVIGVQRQK